MQEVPTIAKNDWDSFVFGGSIALKDVDVAALLSSLRLRC